MMTFFYFYFTTYSEQRGNKECAHLISQFVLQQGAKSTMQVMEMVLAQVVNGKQVTTPISVGGGFK